MNKQRKDSIKRLHKYAISQGGDGRWRTYIATDGNGGRKEVKKATEEALYDFLETVYKEQLKPKGKENLPTFKDCYDKWFEVKSLEFTTGNSIIKYQSDYKRFFMGTEFESLPVEDINEEIIRKFVLTTVKERKLPKKSCRDLCGYIRNTLKSARINKLITENPFEFIEVKSFYPHCCERVKSAVERTVSDREYELLYACFEEDYKKNPSYIVPYAVELCTLTGLRVGEVSALEWSDLEDGMLIIRKSEKHDRATNTKYVVPLTKNHKERVFPITDEIVDLLKRVREAEEKFSYQGNYIFTDEKGRIVSSRVSDYVKSKCRQLGIPNKSIHAFRRTISSRLKCNGVSSTVVGALLGHSEQVNENYYTYDVTNLEEKREFVQMATRSIKKIV